MTDSVPAGEDGLFPDLAPAAETRARQQGGEWTRLHGSTARCDVCAREVAAARGRAPRPALARWRHRGPGGDVLFCYPHAQAARGEASR
jgi:hypothetical protein